MTGAGRTSRGRRAVGVGLGSVALCFAGVFAAGIPTASAESTTSSPSGFATMSVPPPVVAGLASTYTLTYTNPTSAPMSPVTQSTLPAGMTIRGTSNCANLGHGNPNGWNCAMPTLAPGASESATFSIVANGTGTYQIPVSAQATIPIGPSTVEFFLDSLTLSVDVQPGPTDLQVTGSSNNGSPPVGSTFTYTFQVKDNGPLPAFGVTFDDPLPPGIQLTGAVSVDTGSCTAATASNSVHCDIGALAVGQQSTISLAATPTASGVYPDTASVAMTATDTHPQNNSFTVTVQPK